MKYATGHVVRYKPGFGTYGYEDQLDADGRLSAVVVGMTRTRVKIKFTKQGRLRNTTRAVDAKSLRLESR